MSGKTDHAKVLFRRAVERAVHLGLGQDWSVHSSAPGSWTVSASSQTGAFMREFRFSLRPRQHWVEATLAVVRAGSLGDALPWWEDSRDQAAVAGYRTVLWNADQRYAHEERLYLPRDQSEPELIQAIAGFIHRLRGRAEEWFGEARTKLLLSCDQGQESG